MLKTLIFRIIILLYINYLYCIIVLPIDTLPRENYKLLYNINSPQDIIDQEHRNSFFTIYEIGSPLKKVPLIIKPKLNFYFITSIYPVPNKTIEEKKIFNFSKNFLEKYNFYDETKSNSSKINWCRESEYYSAEECCSVNDTIFFYENINMKNKSLKNIDFEMMRNVEDNITGEIGLNIYDAVFRFYNTFLGKLKMNRLISNYNWYFDFDKWDNLKGKLVVGSLPHEDYPNLYSEEDLAFTKSNQLSRTSYMEMKFDNVYIINNDNKVNYSIEAELRYDSKIIVGDFEYRKYLLSKIDYLIKEQKCFNNSIRDFEYYNSLSFYYCKNDEEIKSKLFEIITPIYFYSKDFNYTFEIKNNDILKEKGSYIYIQILFHDIIRKWTLGKVFSLKYKFIFNQDMKQIGFYRKLKTIKETPKDFTILIKTSVIIVLSIILIFLGVKIGKIFNKSRKKRANELVDEYEYYSESNNENKCNINNDSIDNRNIN